jgi:hypothetical protein
VILAQSDRDDCFMELRKGFETVLRVLTRPKTMMGINYGIETWTKVTYRPPLPKPHIRRLPPLSDVTTAICWP